MAGIPHLGKCVLQFHCRDERARRLPVAREIPSEGCDGILRLREFKLLAEAAAVFATLECTLAVQKSVLLTSFQQQLGSVETAF